MSPATAPPATPPLPVQLSASEGAAWLLPPLAMPQRGPQGTRGSYRVLHLIVWMLSTGMPWKGLPVPPAPAGQPAMPSTTVYKVLAPWAEAGALWPALVARVRPLATEKRLAPSGRPGDGPSPGEWPFLRQAAAARVASSADLAAAVTTGHPSLFHCWSSQSVQS